MEQLQHVSWQSKVGFFVFLFFVQEYLVVINSPLLVTHGFDVQVRFPLLQRLIKGKGEQVTLVFITGRLLVCTRFKHFESARTCSVLFFEK